jgi:hypothetical protein
MSIWGDVPTWFTAVGTCGAVIVSLWIARRDAVHREKREQRQQAELITAWLGEEAPADNHQLRQAIVIQNSSHQSVYMLIASLVSLQGAFRDTAVPSPRPKKRGRIDWQAHVGQVPPGQHETSIRSGGRGMNLKLGVELAFRDAAGTCWLRRGDGRLEQVKYDPATLYNLDLPIGWENG